MLQIAFVKTPLLSRQSFMVIDHIHCTPYYWMLIFISWVKTKSQNRRKTILTKCFQNNSLIFRHHSLTLTGNSLRSGLPPKKPVNNFFYIGLLEINPMTTVNEDGFVLRKGTLNTGTWSSSSIANDLNTNVMSGIFPGN